ncbi:MAG: hypothetical protein KJ902_02835 [Candidatus Omnitrophica bacterium]|nr:hypothetical protein [Candidatus Omnitrophota bacterium]
MMNKIIHELKHHMPFTFLGAASGMVFMLIFRNMPREAAHEMFFVFHPLHVLLSALVTASLFKLHTCPKGEGKRSASSLSAKGEISPSHHQRWRDGGCNLPILLAIGFVGSVGIATLSDSIIPYLGEVLVGMPHSQHHIGFLEKWWLISGVAVVGIIIAYFNPSTKFPHAGHVLISTWASLFHVLMAKGENVHFLAYAGIFVFLFIAVWVPCCVSDIIFPMLFVKDRR